MRPRQPHTKETLLGELKSVAEQLGPDVTIYQFRAATGIPPYYIYDRWGNWTNLRRAAGLPVRPHPGPVYNDNELLQEFHDAATEINHFPSPTQFNRCSDRCWNTLQTRFGGSQEIRAKYRQWLKQQPDNDVPGFLKDCPDDYEPSSVPGLYVISDEAIRSALHHAMLILFIAILTLVPFGNGSAPIAQTPSSWPGESAMPLYPPPQPVEHPADLVVDVFGTFLGKRSERMLVRYRQLPPPDPTGTELIPASATAHTAVAETGGEPSAAVAVNTAEVLPAYATPEHPADRVIAQLREIWATSILSVDTPQTTPHARLSEQLDQVADQPERPDSPDWVERFIPLSRLRSVTIAGRGVTVSSDLIETLVERGIGLSFLSRRGHPVAQLSAPGLGGTVQTRRSQLQAYSNPIGVRLAVEFVRGKLRNQKHQLQYSGKYLKTTDPQRFERLDRKIAAIANLRKRLKGFQAPDLDDARDRLMGHEGVGARIYWEGVGILLEGKVDFPGRQTRGATDPVNSALNYGYGILYAQVSHAIANAGLELYAGFLHVDRPGKPSLVLDLIEEFRAPVVDRAILAIVNQGIPLETDEHGLTAATRKLIAARVLNRLSTPVPYESKRWPLSAVIQSQARHLAVAVRGERNYEAFASRW